MLDHFRHPMPSAFHLDEINDEFLLGWRRLDMSYHWPTCDGLVPFIGMISLRDFFENEHIRECLMIDQHPISLFSQARWKHWRISFTIRTFANVSSLANTECPYFPHRDQIVQEFFLKSRHSLILDYSERSVCPFLIIELRWLKNFS